MEDLNPVAAIKERIWSIFNILRSESLSSEDYHIVLFLLSAYNDGIISEEVLSEKDHQKETLVRSIHKADFDFKDQYLPIFESFEPVLKQFSIGGLAEVLHILAGIDKKELSENFPDIFDSVLYRISETQGRYGGELMQPVELTRFICRLADLPENSKVFNPFAGVASFGVFLDQEQNYFGQELNRKTWALGALRLIAYERSGISRYVCGDSILNWPASSERFDLIVSNPPFRLRLDDRYKYFEPGIRTVEQFLIERGVQSLSAKGKLIALLPQGFLFKEGYDRRLREQLVNNDLIDSIISLPGGLLLNTAIPLVILVINKAKKLPGKVRLIDASKFVEEKSPRVMVLNDYKLNSLVHGSKQDDEVVRVIDNDQIRETGYNLNVLAYFTKQFEGVKLRDLVEIIRGKRPKLPWSGKFVRIRDLQNDALNFKLNASSLEKTEIDRAGLSLISESCLLVASRWKTLKPTYFAFEGESILISQDILAFKVNESIIDSAYLINELQSSYVQEQLNSFRVGAVIPSIRREDFLEIVVKVPSLDAQKIKDPTFDAQESLDLQRAKVQGAKEEALKAKEKELGLDSKLKEFKEEYTRDFQSLKHTIRQYLSPLKSNVSGTRKFLRRNEGLPISLSMTYSENLGQTLEEHLQSLEGIVDSINSLLLIDRFSSVQNEKSDLLDLLYKALRKFKDEDSFLFTQPEIDEESLADNDGNKIKPIIGLSEDQFYTLFSNVIDNAKKHGFKASISGNKVKTSLKLINDDVVFQIANNGKPLEQGFTYKHLITLGEKTTDSAGSGTGGADIKRIVDIANGSFEIINDPDADLFKVIYLFKFPLLIED